jgi:ketosteroid isomerase-like protein
MLRSIAAASALLVVSWTGGNAMRQTDQELEARNKALVEAKFAAWASGTGSPYELLADDASWTITGKSLASKRYGGRDAFMREVIRPFSARMSVGLKPTIRNIYAEGNTVIVFFDARGTARDGLSYENTYAWFLDIQDGKVTKASAFFDSIDPNRTSPMGASRCQRRSHARRKRRRPLLRRTRPRPRR